MTEKELAAPDHFWKTSALFRILQDISEDAVAPWGASGADIASKGLMWVVVRYHLTILEVPIPGKTLRVRTWASPVRHMLSQRNYLITDPEGNIIVSAAGLWAVAARDTRSMVDPADYGVFFPTEITGEEVPKPMPPQRLPLRQERRLLVPDNLLDMNQHMNNTCYFDLAEDCIAGENDGLQLREIRAVFMQELLSGENLHIQWGHEGGCWYFSGENQEKECFRISFRYGDSF